MPAAGLAMGASVLGLASASDAARGLVRGVSAWRCRRCGRDQHPQGRMAGKRAARPSPELRLAAAGEASGSAAVADTLPQTKPFKALIFDCDGKHFQVAWRNADVHSSWHTTVTACAISSI